jgi:phage host-nuclease inhibitor protein Gam
MKHKQVLITVCSAVVLIAGCKPTDENQPQVGDSAAAQYDRVKKETREAAQSAKDYAYAQKAEFVEKMKADLADLNKEMDRLAAKVENSSAATKDEAKAKLEALREKTEHLNKKLDSVKDATESTWDEVRAGFKKGYDEVKDSFNQARQWLSDKIAS